MKSDGSEFGFSIIRSFFCSHRSLIFLLPSVRFAFSHHSFLWRFNVVIVHLVSLWWRRTKKSSDRKDPLNVKLRNTKEAIMHMYAWWHVLHDCTKKKMFNMKRTTQWYAHAYAHASHMHNVHAALNRPLCRVAAFGNDRHGAGEGSDCLSHR